MSRIALSIGVSRTEGQRELPGAARDAHAFADWARGRGFEVFEFNDLEHPVEGADLIEAFGEVAGRRGVEQVVVFFAGHGMATGPADDYWFLSRGHEDVVSASSTVRRAANLARLQEVVFFADACRTAAASQHLYAADGAPALFPALAPGTRNARVHVFNAAITGKAAAEIQRRNEDDHIVEANGIFSGLLQRALSGDVSEVIDIDGRSGTRVIRPQKLSVYLEREVPLESSRRTSRTQHPDIRLAPGNEPLFSLGSAELGSLRVRAVLPDGSPAEGSTITVLGEVMPPPPTTVEQGAGPELTVDLAPGIYGVRAELPNHLQNPRAPEPLAYLNGSRDDPLEVTLLPATGLAGGQGPPPPSPSLLERFVLDGDGNRFARPPASGVYTVVHEDVLTGRSRTELRLLEGEAAPELNAPLPADPDAEGVLTEMAGSPARRHYETSTGVSFADTELVSVRGRHAGWGQEGDYAFVRGEEPGSSAVAQLAGGDWAGVGLFFGFQGEAIVGEDGIESLRYAPAEGGPWGPPAIDRGELRRLLVAAEAAARVDRFRVFAEGTGEVAEAVAGLGRLNPMVATFFAYHYAETGETGLVEEILRGFAENRHVVPFDVALLSGLPIGSVLSQVPVIPAFPMLRRGWALLDRLDGVPDVLTAVRPSVGPSMYSTLHGPAGEVLGAVLEAGEIW